MQRVTLVLERTLHEPGEFMGHVYFVEDGIVSITADTRDSGSIEIGLIGIEGVVGVSAALNPDATAIHRAIVQLAGSATRMRTTAFREPWRHRVHSGTAAPVSLNI